MRELHELRFIHPELVLKAGISGAFGQIRDSVKWYQKNTAHARKLDTWLMNLMVMLEKLDEEQVEEVIRKFVLTRSASLRLRRYKKDAGAAVRKLSSKKHLPPSRVYAILEPFSHETALCAMARTRSTAVRSRIKKFFSEYNGTTLSINGGDIKKEGVHPGPGYRKILTEILYRKLDGKLPTRKDEIRCMRELIREQR